MSDNPPVLLLHSVFGKPSLYGHWVRALADAGFTCHVPGLPGRDPTDRAVLDRTGIAQSLAVARAAYDELADRGEPPVIIGHSIGGLLGQMLAATTDCRALVLLASIPPGVLWPQPRSLPHLIPVLPAVLAGRAFLPSPRTMRALPLSTLPTSEQDTIGPELVADSGRVFRSLTFGLPDTRIRANAVRCPVLCVSGDADRNVANWLSRRLAARYRAEHHVHPGLPHWIVAESALPRVAPPVLAWLTRILADGPGPGR